MFVKWFQAHQAPKLAPGKLNIKVIKSLIFQVRLSVNFHTFLQPLLFRLLLSSFTWTKTTIKVGRHQIIIIIENAIYIILPCIGGPSSNRSQVVKKEILKLSWNWYCWFPLVEFESWSWKMLKLTLFFYWSVHIDCNDCCTPGALVQWWISLKPYTCFTYCQIFHAMWGGCSQPLVRLYCPTREWVLVLVCCSCWQHTLTLWQSSVRPPDWATEPKQN